MVAVSGEISTEMYIFIFNNMLSKFREIGLNIAILRIEVYINMSH